MVGVVTVFGAAGSGGGGENSPFWWALWGVFALAMGGVALAQRAARRGAGPDRNGRIDERPAMSSKLPMWRRGLVAAGATAIAVVGYLSGSPGAGRYVVPGLALVFAVLSLIGVTPFGTDNRRSRFWQ